MAGHLVCRALADQGANGNGGQRWTLIEATSRRIADAKIPLRHDTSGRMTFASSRCKAHLLYGAPASGDSQYSRRIRRSEGVSGTAKAACDLGVMCLQGARAGPEAIRTCLVTLSGKECHPARLVACGRIVTIVTGTITDCEHVNVLAAISAGGAAR